MPRREFDTLLGHKIEKGIMLRRDGFMDRRHHTFIGLRSRDREHTRIGSADRFRFRPHAARDNDLSIFAQRFTNRGKRFRFGAVEKTAGVHDHCISAIMAFGQFISLSAQTRDDALAIDKRLGAAQRDKRDFWRWRGHGQVRQEER